MLPKRNSGVRAGPGEEEMMLFHACGLDRVLGACAVHTDTAALSFTNIALGLTTLIVVAMVGGAVLHEGVSRARKGD